MIFQTSFRKFLALSLVKKSFLFLLLILSVLYLIFRKKAFFFLFQTTLWIVSHVTSLHISYKGKQEQANTILLYSLEIKHEAFSIWIPEAEVKNSENIKATIPLLEVTLYPEGEYSTNSPLLYKALFYLVKKCSFSIEKGVCHLPQQLPFWQFTLEYEKRDKSLELFASTPSTKNTLQLLGKIQDHDYALDMTFDGEVSAFYPFLKTKYPLSQLNGFIHTKVYSVFSHWDEIKTLKGVTDIQRPDLTYHNLQLIADEMQLKWDCQKPFKTSFLSLLQTSQTSLTLSKGMLFIGSEQIGSQIELCVQKNKGKFCGSILKKGTSSLLEGEFDFSILDKDYYQISGDFTSDAKRKRNLFCFLKTKEKEELKLDLTQMDLSLIPTAIWGVGIEKGELSGNLFLKWNRTQIEKIYAKDLLIHNVNINWKEHHFLASQIALGWEDAKFSSTFLDVHVLDYQKREIAKNLSGSVSLQKGKLPICHIQGELFSIPSNLDIVAEEKNQDFLFTAVFPLEPVLCVISGRKWEGSAYTPYSFALNAFLQEEQVHLQGEAFAKEEGVNIDLHLPINKDLRKIKGHLQAKNIDLAFFLPLYRPWIKEVELISKADVSAFLQEGSLTIDIPLTSFELAAEGWQLEQKQQKDHLFPLELAWDLKTGVWSGHLPVFEADFKGEYPLLSVKGISSSFELKDNKIQAQKLAIQDEKLQLLSQVSFDLKKEHWLFELYNLHFDIHPFFEKMEGSCHLKGRSSSIEFQKEEDHWKASFCGRFGIDLTKWALSPHFSLQGGSWIWDCSDTKKQYLFQENKANLYYQGDFLASLFLHSLEWDNDKQFTLQAGLEREKKKIVDAHLKGCFEKEVKLDPSSSITLLENIPLTLEAIEFKAKTLSHLIIRSKHSFADLKEIGYWQAPSSFKEKLEAFLDQNPSTMQWVFSYDTSSSHFKWVASVDSLAWKEELFTSVIVELDGLDKTWQLNIQGDPKLNLSAYFLKAPEGLQCQKWSLDWGGLSSFGKASFTKDQQLSLQVEKAVLDEAFLKKIVPEHPFITPKIYASFELKGSPVHFKGDLSFTMESQKLNLASFKPVSFTFVAKEGLAFLPFELNYQLVAGKKGKFTAESLYVHDGAFNLQNLKYHFTKEEVQLLADMKWLPDWTLPLMKNQSFQGYLSFRKDKTSRLLQGKCEEAKVEWEDNTYLLSQLYYDLEDRCFCLRANSQKEKVPLNLEMRLDFEPDLHGVINLRSKGEKEPLKVYFRGFQKDLPKIERIKGFLRGIEVDLKKNKQALEGMIRLDWSECKDFFSQEIQSLIEECKLGSGYTFLGSFNLFGKDKSFNGHLLGEELYAFGYYFQFLKAGLIYHEGKVEVNNLSLQDEAMCLNMKRALIRQEESWDLSCPLIQVSDFCPSLLRSTKKEIPERKPLIIKRISIKDIQGPLMDPKYIKGKGDLYFVNQKDNKGDFFALPRSFFKDLGLDPSILNPISGELSFYIQDKKALITYLSNVRSEEGRSQFILSNDSDNYIDFNGNVNVDVLIKQNVVLKLMQPFTLSIRGNVKKPKFSFKG